MDIKKWIHKAIAVLIFIGYFQPTVSGQLPANSIGSNPFSLKWSKINSDKATLIFPSDMDSTAFQANNIIEYLWQKDLQDDGIENKKLPILMHGLRVNPNGFVIVGPFRSEFYTIPSQFKTTTAWIDNLTIHEYRHVNQFSNADRGISKIGKTLFGSWIWGGLFATALPRWYYEGDAVVAETSLTNAGRGRFPYFNMEYHTLLHHKKDYNYEKASAGSLKDFVPNWYKTGYHMVAYGRKQYGSDIWQKVETDALAFKGLIYPFSKSLKKHTGQSPEELYNETIQDLRSQWEQLDIFIKDDARIISNSDKSTVINYCAPVGISRQRIAFIKNGYNQISQLFLMENGKEKKLTDLGFLIDGEMTTLSYGDGKLVWAEQGFNPRWRNETYSDIVYYDLYKEKRQKVTTRNRYFSPDITHDGNQIAAIRISRDLNHHLTIIDTESGEENQALSFPFGSELSYPQWIGSDQIAYIHTRSQENEVRVFDIEKGIDQTLTGMLAEHLSHLYYDSQRKLLLTDKEIGEVQNICYIDLKNGALTQWSDVIIGAFQPAIWNDSLVFAELGIKGYDLKSIAIPSNRPASVQTTRASVDLYHESMASYDGGNILDQLPEVESETASFSSLGGLLNFHSLIPEWQPPVVRLSALSDDVFGTLSSDVNTSYNYNEEEFTFGAGLQYAALYPILSANYSMGNRNALFYKFNGLTDTSIVQTITVDRWKENQFSTGIRIPYNFSGGSYLRNISVSASYQFTTIKLKDGDFRNELRRDTLSSSIEGVNSIRPVFSDPLSDGNLHTLDLSFSFAASKFRALQHLRTRLGFSLAARYRRNIGQNNLGGNTFATRAFLYLPGIRSNHSLMIEGMYVKENILSDYRYGDVFAYPRGYDISLRRDDFLKIGVNYALPLAYPDLALGGFAFIKRLKVNLFFDYGRFGIGTFPFHEQYNNANSMGIELGVDFRALRLLEIDLGVRYSHLINPDFSPNGRRHQFDFFVISITE